MANNNTDVRVRLSAEGVQDVVNALRRIQSEGRNASSGTDSLAASMASLRTNIMSLAGATGLLLIGKQIGDAAAAGIEYNQVMEDAEMGIAAVIAAQAKIVDGQNQQLEGIQAFNAAQKMSAELMVELKRLGLQTAATTKELASAFQAGLSAALGAGITDLEKILNLSVKITQAAAAMGVPMSMLRQEIVSIFRGDITKDSVVASNLGLKSADIERWKQAGTLADELNKRLETFAIAAQEANKTYTVLSANVKEALQTLAGESTKTLFEGIKTGLGATFDSLFDKQGKLIDSWKPVVAIVNEVAAGIGESVGNAVQGVIESVKELSVWIGKNEFEVRDLFKGFKMVGGQVFGLIGDIIKVFTNISKSSTETGALGVAWRTVAVVIAGARDGLRLIQGVVAKIGSDIYDLMITPLAALIEGAGRLKNLVRGEGAGAGAIQLAESLRNATKQSHEFAATVKKDFETANTEVGKLLKEFDNLGKKTIEQNKKVKDTGAEKPSGKIEGLRNPIVDPNADANQKARADFLEAAASNQLKIIQAKNKLLSAQEKQDFEDGLISLAEYYASRKRIIESESTAEAKILQDKLEAAQSLPATNKQLIEARNKAIDTAQTDIELANIGKKEKLANLEAERLAKVRELAAGRLQIDQRLLELQNKKLEAQDKSIELEKQNLTLQLKRQGLTDAEIQSQLTIYENATRANNTYDQAVQNLQLALQDLSRERAAIEAEQQAGKLSQIEAEQKILDLETARLPVLQQLATAQQNAAVATNDQAKQAEAKDQAAQIQQLQIGAQKAQFTFANLKATAMDALQGGITNGLLEAANGAKSFSDAMRGVALSVVSAIQQMIAQFIALAIVKKIAGMGGGFSGGGIVGVDSIGGAGTVTAATGGFITGPGTGTSDSIPAMLSNGEFVVRAGVVNQPGVLEMLTQLNSGVNLTRSTPRRFVDGGIVGAGLAKAGGSNSSLTVGLEKGLVLSELKTADGQRLLIEMMTKNRRAMRTALGM